MKKVSSAISNLGNDPIRNVQANFPFGHRWKNYKY